MIEKVCAWCGGPVAPSSDKTRHQKYCCRECRDNAAAERDASREKDRRVIERAKAREAQPHGLDECVKEAERLGISYGRYMARRQADGNET